MLDVKDLDYLVKASVASWCVCVHIEELVVPFAFHFEVSRQMMKQRLMGDSKMQVEPWYIRLALRIHFNDEVD